jgi:serine protein kinase
MNAISNIIASFREDFSTRLSEGMSIEEYLTLCKEDKTTYATPAERMLAAIGEPKTVDTSRDERLGRIFGNRNVRFYPAFSDFYGMEDTVERIVNYFRHAAQGLEERKQVLYLLGPVGGGKSSLAERLKHLMEKQPIYVLKFRDEMSPVFESPLGLFSDEKWHSLLQSDYDIPARRLTAIPSPWAVKRLKECNGDLSQFNVVKLYPSMLEQIAISKTEPGDDNNQDISVLVGKVDIRKLEDYSQADTDAYGYSGGLNRANQGLLEFVEMFKAPIKMLHPLLTATQEGNYVGTENIGAIPFQGIILAHSNEAEWETFRNDRKNEAFIDRVYLIKVPYALRVTEEEKIYKKLIEHSELASAPCAPGTLEMLARFCVLSRLKEHKNSNLWSKMMVYDGKSMREKDPQARAVHEYRQEAGQDEGMNGYSTRAAFKVLSAVYNFDPTEISADQIHLMMVLEESIKREQFKNEEALLNIIKDELQPRFLEDLRKVINAAFLESYEEYGQNVFDNYFKKAEAWVEDVDYKDPETGTLLNRDQLNSDLQKIEQPAGISNVKDFRAEIVRYYLRVQANTGKAPSWKAYDKFAEVIEKNVFSNVDSLLPVISFSGSHRDEDTAKKHSGFVQRMLDKGYTEKMTRRYVEFYTRYHRS